MNIFKILTGNGIRILKLINNEAFHIREIADTLNISPGSVHKFIKLLKSCGLIKESRQKNCMMIHLNKDNLVVKHIKAIINLNDLLNATAYNDLKKLGEVGIYGSFANGTNDKESDLDMWIKTDIKELELRPTIRKLEKQLNIKVNPLILTKQKIESFKKNDPEFYIRLKLTSVGDAFD